eukprot:TRINITY_DN115105_c0_g1_i1.p1 TRINITY_DN115105_c0_g1~~TRINITY_DN115105_c0_g1_i1.p1  ORF type:complete len:336 (-),score=34.60 TRINITY_DN115105_c0_g1_i1:96-1103(-)
MLAVPLFVLLVVIPFSAGKPVIIADTPDQHIIQIDNLSSTPRITRMASIQTPSPVWFYMGSCGDKKRGLLYHAWAQPVNPVKFPIYTYISTFDLRSWKNVSRTPEFTLPTLFQVHHCDNENNAMVAVLIDEGKNAPNNTEVVVSIDLTTGKWTQHAHVSEKHRPGFFAGDDGYDAKTHSIVWDWVFRGDTPRSGVVIAADVNTGKVVQAPYKNQSFQNMAFNGKEGLMMYATNLTIAHGPNGTQNLRQLIQWDLSTNKITKIGPIHNMHNGTTWATNTPFDAAGYYSPLVQLPSGATVLQRWNISTGQFTNSAAILNQEGGKWLGPYNWWNFFDL